MSLLRRLSVTATLALSSHDKRPSLLIGRQVMKFSAPFVSLVSLFFFTSPRASCQPSHQCIAPSRIIYKGTLVYIHVSSETDLRQSLDHIKLDIHMHKKNITNIIFKTRNRPLILFAEGKFIPAHSRPDETLNDLIRNFMIQESKSLSGIPFAIVDTDGGKRHTNCILAK